MHVTIIVWFRQDLRLDDHPALFAALRAKAAIVPVYVHAPADDGAARLGAASRWWLHSSLAALDTSLRERHGRLVLREGPTVAALTALVQDVKATAVYWNRRYEPGAAALEEAVTAALKKIGCAAESFSGNLLYEPWDIKTKTATPYRVFTPFWRACIERGDPVPPVGGPKEMPAPPSWPKSVPLAHLGLKPKIAWDSGLAAVWTPGEAGAKKRLQAFARSPVTGYISGRDTPSVDGTSGLSSHLAFGEISPRQIWAKLSGQAPAIKPAEGNGAAAFVRQLGWREFAYHLLYHYPATVREPLRPEFKVFPWEQHPDWLAAWQQGQTGFPIVDAGMRQLWQTGWMHNRVRMIVGSFLVKDLLIPWQEGARWFWDTLVDADLANNTMGWQWIGGCGADASPYFRVYNPVGQGERHDPDGDYVRQWVPELRRLPAAWVHKPHAAPAEVLRRAGVTLGQNYPEPVVDHARARIHALHAYEAVRQQARLDKAKGKA